MRTTPPLEHAPSPGPDPQAAAPYSLVSPDPLLVVERRHRRLVIVWAVLFSVAAVTATFLHLAAWREWSGPDRQWGGKTAANTTDVLLAPGWAVVLKVFGYDAARNPVPTAIAAMLSCAAYFAVVVLYLRFRRRWLRRRASKAAAIGVDFSRRRFVLDYPAAACALALPASVHRAASADAWDLKTVRYTLPISGLHPAFHNLTIAIVSDTHLGPRVPAAYIRSAVRRVIDLSPDLVALVGDYVHYGSRYIEQAANLFVPLCRAFPDRVAGVLGNHDWYADGRAMSQALTDVGVIMLDNSRAFFSRVPSVAGSTPMLPRDRLSADAPPPDEPTICIAGLGDYYEDVVDPVRALAGVPDDVPRIVLAHNPDTAEHPALLAPQSRPASRGVGGVERVERSGGAERVGTVGGEGGEGGVGGVGGVGCERGVGSGPVAARIDLMLSGHTHGGQVRVPFLGTPFVPSKHGQKYSAGLVQGPAFPVLVSRGVGMSIVPVRWGVPPEIVHVTLVPA